MSSMLGSLSRETAGLALWGLNEGEGYNKEREVEVGEKYNQI